MPPWRTATLAVLVVTACGGRGYTPPADDPAITGELTRVTASDADDESRMGSVLVEVEPDEPSGSLKMSLRVSDATQLLRWNADAGGYGTFEFGDLRAGMRVRAWVSGPIMESYPAQATAHTIELLEQTVEAP